jgi:hypothetical protein
MNDHEESHHSPHKLPPALIWPFLNADGLLLAILCFAASTDLFDPYGTLLARTIGYIPPAFYLWTSLYIAAGFLLVCAFIGREKWRMPLELSGRFLLVFAYTLEVWRTAIGVGWLNPHVVTSYLILAVLIGVVAARSSLLLSRDGCVVVIGGRK